MPTPALDAVVRSDPEILGGTPVFAGTRVPVKNLVDYLAAGDTLERFLDHFPSVTQNLEYQQNLATLPVAVVVMVSGSNRLEALEPLVPSVLDLLKSLQPKTLRRVGA